MLRRHVATAGPPFPTALSHVSVSPRPLTAFTHLLQARLSTPIGDRRFQTADATLFALRDLPIAALRLRHSNEHA